MSHRFFYRHTPQDVMQQLGDENLVTWLRSMLLIRQFELRGEACYQQGWIGGFYHTYIGQEAIQTAALAALGPHHWYSTTYRCHALALLLGASPKVLMAELFGKVTGNALGRGGSMHLYADRLLGGFAIVGGHLPIAAGAAFSMKYLKKTEMSICFLGEGAVAQGAFHEALNLASLWDLPVMYVIENNQWGMGTAVHRAICTAPIAEMQAKSYGIEGITLDGMDFFNCYDGFSYAKEQILKTSKPILIECQCERFRGHSISDPGLYRTSEQMEMIVQHDPIIKMKELLGIDDSVYRELENLVKQEILEAIEYAKESPWPEVATLEEGVYAS